MSPTDKYRIAIIGPTEMVSGFLSLGLEVIEASTGVEVLERLQKIKSAVTEASGTPPYAVICVIESLLQDTDLTEYDKFISGPLPSVVMLPGPEGASGVALSRLRRLAERAVGSAII